MLIEKRDTWATATSRPRRIAPSWVSEGAVSNHSAITKANFQFVYPIGRGGFGKVWRVESKKVKGETFAMKEMCKARVMAKKSVQSVMNELKLLSQVKSQ